MAEKVVRRNSGGSSGSRRPKGRGFFGKLFVFLVWMTGLGALAVAAGIAAILIYYSAQVPDFRALAEYKPPLITKVFDRNNEVIAEFARERRVWMPIDQIPKGLIQAYLAAEDSNFYEHGGYDLRAIARAAIMNVLTHRTQGASTITQQVAKTFLLSSERTYTRKIKELILSWRIEKAFTKNQILELYLNRIYLGNGSYGVAAAAQTYFSKNLDELNLSEKAMLAGMPQAPTRYNPVRNPEAAKNRRNIVLKRMLEENFITQDLYKQASGSPLQLNLSPLKQGEDAPHFSEYIRRMVEKEYGEDGLYNAGLSIYTTVDLKMQREAEQAVYKGLREYDRRHGWRGPVSHLPSMTDWEGQLETIVENYLHSARIGRPAVVLSVGAESFGIGLDGGQKGTVTQSGFKWTGRWAPKSLVKVGDVVFVKPLGGGKNLYALEQLPKVQGALVALDVRTGEVLAMVGGLGEGVGFNRALQAKRQLGSSFKPFVYAAALEKGYTPATIVLDAPVVFRDGDKEWKPGNYDNKIGGPSTLRRGLEKSRNLMTVRMAQDIGLRPVADVVKRVGFGDKVNISDLSTVLGSIQQTLMDTVAAYAVFPRGGMYVAPSYIRRIQDSQGTTLVRSLPLCDGCVAMMSGKPDVVPTPPAAPMTQAFSPQISYQMVSMLEGVVQRGTAASLRGLGRPLAGKTGTTNDYIDAWFIGFSPSIAVGVWVGMDTPQSLGHGETGAKAAVPIWKEFMAQALEDQPVETFAVPDGIEFVRIDADSGQLPGPSTQKTLLEAFIPGTAPTTVTQSPEELFGTDPNAPEGEGGAGFNPFGIF